MRIWMAMEPDNTLHPRRVAIQSRPLEPWDFPPAHPGGEWEIREGEIDEETWAGLLSGQMDDDETDRVHRDLWSQNGDTPWVPPPSR